MSLSRLHFRVCDKGLFLPIALRLARDAGRVTYWSPADEAFPSVRKCCGDGFADIARVPSIFHDHEDVDCFVFPDIGFASEQRLLRDLGHKVWGSLGGCELENLRGKFLDTLERTGLPVPPHRRVRGITALREHLRGVSDRWIKISGFRGDWETLHWRSWDEDESTLDQKATRLGPFREHVTFYVFEPIDSDIEDGCDSWCVGGKFPKLVIHGMEAKDKAYLGTFQRFADLPEELRVVSDAFGPILGKYGYRSFFSTEVRITEEGESYFIDPTCRAGSPPSQVMTEMIGNYAEVIWGGANGECVDPEPAAKFGAQAIMSAKGKPCDWRNLKLEPGLERWVKCGKCVQDSGMVHFLPEEGGDQDVGWVVGIGDTMDEAIRHLRHNVERLPDGATCEFASLADLLHEVQEAEEQGMEFTDQPVPEPASVLEG